MADFLRTAPVLSSQRGCGGRFPQGEGRASDDRVRAAFLGDITEEEYAAAVSVLQRITDNLAQEPS
ncbi:MULTISPECIES: hypothetical protein [Kitasatospora]|uniref:MarR family transcriptional regulator n=1 Tax=Kitasatospora cathayae TaxID=3004092 RepID=A0ABY7QCP5_9ACTN|nr:hypothetical protein [Kitasatospora sp. HUAS 3-15]WBP90372.1 hypothetical protein O1G21_33955 [Kitasatospora sp. HUAS 3-15]